jgi:hypothetical protein
MNTHLRNGLYLLILSAAAVFGQGTTADVVGTTTDATGVVPNATVEI